MKCIVKISKPKSNNTTRISMPAQIVEQIKLLECDYVEMSTDGKNILVEPNRRSYDRNIDAKLRDNIRICSISDEASDNGGN